MALTHAVRDTLAAAQPEGGGDVFAHLLHHLYDAHVLELPFLRIELPHFPPVTIAGIVFDFSITKHLVFLWLAAAILCIGTVLIARKSSRRLVPTGAGNLLEIFLVFVRDEIVIPNMGAQGVRYLPYLLTTFFFILLMNVLGLFPYGASSTGNVNVTAGLAIIAFFMIQYAAIRAQGLGHYLRHLTGGVHWSLWPIMVPIEVLGLFTKAFALCVRLFANMIGGHTVIVSLIGLIFLFHSFIVAVAPASFVVAINFLEIFVAALQAYIFTMLTSLFMGLGMQAEGDEHHAESPHDAARQ